MPTFLQLRALLIAGVLGLVLFATESRAQSSSLEEKVDARLQSALSELATVRRKIASEKIPLSREIGKLESEILELKRRELALHEATDSRTIDLGTLRKRVDVLREQDEFVESRLTEFVRDFEARLDISEMAAYETTTHAARLAANNPNLEAEARRRTHVDVVRAAVARLSEQIGGRVYAGEALGPDGVLRAGNFVALGPTVFYASEDGSTAGLVEARLNAADPVVVPIPGDSGAGIASVASSGAGELPFDATLGKALKIEKARKSLLAYIEEGGVVGLVIVVLGFAALVVTAFKVVEIRNVSVATPAQVDAVLDDLARGQQEGALVRSRGIAGVSGEILKAGVLHAAERREVLEEVLFEKILSARPRLERYLPFLSLTAAASPLLGLLGTVIGMIKTFQLITIFGTGDAKSLSSGISEALVTTALGLIVAIPTLVLHGALSRMAKRKLGQLEELSVAFVNGVTSIRSRDESKLLEPNELGEAVLAAECQTEA